MPAKRIGRQKEDAEKEKAIKCNCKVIYRAVDDLARVQQLNPEDAIVALQTFQDKGTSWLPKYPDMGAPNEKSVT